MPSETPDVCAPDAIRSLELQALLDATVDAVIIINHRGHIELFNRSAERLFGYQESEVLDRNVSVLMTTKDHASHDAYMERYIDTGIPHIIGIGREVDAQRKDGSVFPAFLSVGRIQQTEPPRFVGFLQDITLRRQALAAVQRERDRANRYLEAAQTILVALDAQGGITLLNRRGTETLGVSEDTVLGADWLSVAVSPEDQAIARDQLEGLLTGRLVQPHYCEYHVRTANGDRRLVAWRCVTVKSRAGDITGVLCSGDDITERRAAEQEARQAQERMTHVSRLATMGEMAAGIAHELNQPLSAITTYAQASLRLLAAPETDVDEVADALRQIANQALRAGEIIRRLRSLVRNSETQREAAAINDVIEELSGLTNTDARMHDVRLTLQLAPGLPQLQVDRIQIQQVVLNLLRNAIEALDEVSPDAREILVRTRLVDGDVEVSVCDTGPGVAPEIADRMFHPFCTTKPTGTGLGLAISRTIVRAHKGELGYTANTPRGACFYFHLPALQTNGS